MAAVAKKDAIVGAGRLLFLRHGIRKVRVEQVCADARVSKRTFYKYFRNKDDLAIAVLAGLFEENRTRIEAVLALDCPIEDKVRRVIAVRSQLAAETSATFYREALDSGTEAGRFALREQRTWDDRLRAFYTEARAAGQIREDIDIDVLMAVIERIRGLARDRDLVRLVPDFSILAEQVMKLFFYGIVPRGRPDRPSARRRERRKVS